MPWEATPVADESCAANDWPAPLGDRNRLPRFRYTSSSRVGRAVPNTADRDGRRRNRSQAGRVSVILSAAKDLGGSALVGKILRCAQDDDSPVNGQDVGKCRLCHQRFSRSTCVRGTLGE